MDLDADLVKDLCCPRCKAPVTYQEAADPGTSKDGGFVCEACQLKYMVVDGIPNFLVKDAVAL